MAKKEVLSENQILRAEILSFIDMKPSSFYQIADGLGFVRYNPYELPLSKTDIEILIEKRNKLHEALTKLQSDLIIDCALDKNAPKDPDHSYGDDTYKLYRIDQAEELEKSGILSSPNVINYNLGDVAAGSEISPTNRKKPRHYVSPSRDIS